MGSDNMMVLQNKIGELFRLLRGEIRAENYTVILLFIYLRSTNLFSEITQNEENQKESLIEVLKNTNETTPKKIFNVFLPTINKLSEQSISDVIELLKSIDSDLLNENISEIYDDTLNRIVLSQSRVSAEFMQPKQLTEFIKAYIGSTKHLKIYNPFAGVASLIKGIEKSKSIYAQEINLKTWAVGQLRLIVSNSNAVYNCDDSIMNWPTNEKFDLIVSNPPFMLRLNGDNRDKYPEYRNVEDFLLGISLNSLSDNGKLITVLPTGVLFRGRREREIRERLIQDDLLETIISFPSGLLHHTSMPFVVMILNKAKENSEIVKLVNAGPFVSKPSERESFISVNELLQTVNGNESDSVRIISNQDVIKNNFNLNIARYFVEDIDGVRLGDILQTQRGTRVKPQETGKMIRIRDLKNDTIDFHLNISESEEILLDRPDFRKIESSCILLAKRWKTLKPTFFQFQNEPIYIASDVFAFHVDESKVDINYLVNELHSDYVQQQIEGYSTGATIPSIVLNDLLEIKIKLLSIDEQRDVVNAVKSEKIDKLQSQILDLNYSENVKGFNEFASLKHTLGRPRQNILSWSKNLANFFIREKKKVLSFDDEFKNLFDLGIVEAINEINRDIKFISDVLEKGENGLVLKDYNKKIIPLSEINQIIENVSSNEFNFSIQKQPLETDEMDKRGIYINDILLKTLIDNVLTNANKHGFKDNKDENLVVILLEEDDNQLIVEIKNNGIPFPKNFDKEKFITKYKTADQSNGSGLGGYDINRIATYFGNESWELQLNNDIYPVIFRFSFSLKPLN
jgi:type I restriction enzyme M protein